MLGYSLERTQAIYRSRDLASLISALEGSASSYASIVDLGRVVNTSQSQNEPISRWVRYREGYSPSLVEFLLRRFPVTNGGFVLDPMCGSGSTQLAAQNLGLDSMGTDVSPYAVLVSNVKTRTPSSAVAERLRSVPLSTVRQAASRRRIGSSDKHLLRYFPLENLRALLAIRDWVKSHLSDSPVAYDFALVALLSIVETCSNRRKDGNGLAVQASKVTDPVGQFELQLDLMLDDLPAERSGRTPSTTHLISALDVDASVEIGTVIFKRQLGSIIFSPPYANSFDYFESYKLELLFGEFYTVKELQLARKNLIRSYRQSGTSSACPDIPGLEPLIDEIVSGIPEKEKRTGSYDSRSRLVPNMLRGYFSDMKTFLQRASKVMPHGSRMHIVVDQSAYLGVPVPTDLLLAAIGSDCDLAFKSLLVCRAARTSAQQLAVQPLLREVLRESVVTLEKA